MNPKNDYLDYEIRKLRLDTKIAQKKGDTKLLLKFLVLLIPLLSFVISLHATPAKSFFKHHYARQIDGGIQFTCKRCRMSQWQDRRQSDWAGNFYCKSCGTQMGAE